MRLATLLLETQKEDRAEFIKKQLGGKLSLIDNDVDGLLAKIANADPTPNGSIMPWIARLIAKDPNANKIEDLPRLNTDLQTFMARRKDIPNKDINSYKSFESVYDAIAPFLVKRKPTPDERAEARKAAKIAKFKSEIETVYAGPEGWIRIPHSKGASQFLGQGTRWCTSAKKDNMFNYYNESDKLFIVFDKSSKERFQLHINSGSYADSADKMQGLEALPSWARPPIIAWYTKNRPPQDLKTTMSLHKIDLMAQYGV
jgi:hypothetical protein